MRVCLERQDTALSQPASQVTKTALHVKNRNMLILSARLGGPDLAAGIRRVKGAKRLGVRVGNWLSAEQGRTLLAISAGPQLREVRNRAILAVLIGCGLRRAELVTVKVEDLQLREDHWVLADLIGKGGHVRTVPVPDWVKSTVDAWIASANIQNGVLFRSVSKVGRVWGTGFTPKVIWSIVRKAATDCGFGTAAPPDLRRTCARLSHQAR